MDEIVTSVRLPRAQHDALRLRAEREHRTLSGELRRIIEGELAKDAAPPVVTDLMPIADAPVKDAA